MQFEKNQRKSLKEKIERKNLVNNGMILQRTMQAGKRAAIIKDEMPKVSYNIYKGPA